MSEKVVVPYGKLTESIIRNTIEWLILLITRLMILLSISNLVSLWSGLVLFFLC